MPDTNENFTEPKTAAENLSDHLVDYAEGYLKLAVVSATRKATDAASAALSSMLFLFLCFFLLLFAGIGIAVWLGDMWANPKAGYFAVAGFYVLAIAVFIAIRRKVILPFLKNRIVRRIYE